MFSGGHTMNKKIGVLGLIFMVIVGVSFSFGIFKNPTFNINEFCANLSSEFIGWILAVTIFQYYYDEKMAARKSHKGASSSNSIADEILKLKSLLDRDVITQEEFDKIKARLLTK